LSERWTYNYFNGRKWLSEVLADLHHNAEDGVGSGISYAAALMYGLSLRNNSADAPFGLQSTSAGSMHWTSAIARHQMNARQGNSLATAYGPLIQAWDDGEDRSQSLKAHSIRRYSWGKAPIRDLQFSNDGKVLAVDR
jgi:hypothetical protein